MQLQLNNNYKEFIPDFDLNDSFNSIVTSIDKSRSDFFNRVNNVVKIQDINFKNPNKDAGDLTGGSCTFNISEINGNDKFSIDYFDCTGLVCSGISKETGSNISFLSHQDTLRVLNGYNQDFENLLIQNFMYMLDKCYTETISVGLFGGNLLEGTLIDSEYIKVTRMIKSIVYKVLHKDLNILIGPNSPISKRIDLSSHFHFDNFYGVLYASKPEQSNRAYNESFIHDDLIKKLNLFK